MSYQPPPNRPRLENTMGRPGRGTKKHTESRNKRTERGDLRNSCRVKCQWWGSRGVGGAFSSTAEVWDGGWRAVMACGCLLRSLLKPILSKTAGGVGSVRGQSRRRREKKKKNQWSCWRPSSRSARRSHSHGSRGFLLLSIPQLDPFFPFYFHSPSNSVLQFLSS